MPAYARKLEETCYADGCGRTAKVEVVDSRNQPRGRYCSPHGKERLQAVQTEEASNSASDRVRRW